MIQFALGNIKKGNTYYLEKNKSSKPQLLVVNHVSLLRDSISLT